MIDISGVNRAHLRRRNVGERYGAAVEGEELYYEGFPRHWHVHNSSHVASLKSFFEIIYPTIKGIYRNVASQYNNIVSTTTSSSFNIVSPKVDRRLINLV